MKNTLIYVLTAIFISLMVGCSTIQTANVCDGMDSVLCEASVSLDVPLKTISTALKVGNVAGLSGNLYTAQQAYDFIVKIETDIGALEKLTLNGNGGSYKYFITLLMDKYDKLSPEVQALFIIFGDGIDLSIPELTNEILTPYDFVLLKRHLSEQKLIILPFVTKNE